MPSFPSSVSTPGPFLKKVADVSQWIEDIQVREIGNNMGFTTKDGAWGKVFTSWAYEGKPSEIPGASRQIPKGKSGPYCGVTVGLIVKIAAQFSNDLQEDERKFILNITGYPSSSFFTALAVQGSPYVALVAKPQPGSINSRTASGSGHVNITVMRRGTGLITVNGNGSCTSSRTDERDGSGGGSGMCFKTSIDRSLRYHVIFRVGGKFPVENGNSLTGRSAGAQSGGFVSATGDSPGAIGSGGGSAPGGIVGAPPAPPPPPPRKLRTFGVVVVGDLGSEAAASGQQTPSNPKSRTDTASSESKVISNPSQPLDTIAVSIGESNGNVDRAREEKIQTQGASEPQGSVRPPEPKKTEAANKKSSRSRRNKTDVPKSSNPKPSDKSLAAMNSIPEVDSDALLRDQMSSLGGAPQIPTFEAPTINGLTGFDIPVELNSVSPTDEILRERNAAETLGTSNRLAQIPAERAREAIDASKRAESNNVFHAGEKSTESIPGTFDPNVVEYVPEYEEEGVNSGDPPEGYQDGAAEAMGYVAEGDADGSLGNNAKRIGGGYPLVSINGYTFPEEEIKTATIDCRGFYPVLSLTVFIKAGSFLSRKFPKDGDVVSVFIRSKQDQLKPIRNDYIITNVDTSNSQDAEGGGIAVFITGNLRIPLLYAEICKSIKGTSLEALLQISKDLQLGFVTNETSTEDSMTWRCAYSTYKDFIREITDHSWKDDASFFTCFIDIYYNLNFINLNKIYSMPDTAEMRDALVRSDMNVDYTSDNALAHAKTKHLLTNYPQYRGTNYFVESIRMENLSGEINLVNGYKRYTYFYDKGTETVQDFWVDPITTEGAEESKVLQKGRSGENYYRDQTKRKWMGIQVSGENGNVHPYFKFAKMHNFQNREEQHKMNIVTILPSVNLNLHVNQRVPVLFTITRDPSRVAHAGNTSDEPKKNGWTPDRFITGNYCVTGIIYNFYGGRNPKFEQEVILSKREWAMPTNDPRYSGDDQKYAL